MEGVFTRLAQAIPADPSQELMRAAWSALAEALRTELRRRGLWTAPPSYLGVLGWDRWDVGAPGGSSTSLLPSSSAHGPLDELVADCFTYNFVDRLRSLLAQLRTKPRIDGLVLLNVRHFVYERQRRHDPVGFRVFEVVREAVEEGIHQGVMSVSGDGQRIANTTVISLGQDQAPIAARAALAEVVERWNDDLLPDLLVVVGKRRRAVIEHLVTQLEALVDEGISRFRFKDLIDPLKHDARARWGTFMAQTHRRAFVTTAGSEADAAIHPDDSFEERQNFEWLAGEVASLIESIDTDPRRRDYLARLWTFLAPTGRPGSGQEQAPVGRRTSGRRLEKLLGIPRERLPELKTTLGELLNQIRDPPTSPRHPS